MSETKEALEQEVAALEARVAELKVLNELRDRVAALKVEIDRLSGATEARLAPCLLPHYPHWCARRHVDDSYPSYPTQPWVTWCGAPGEVMGSGTYVVKASNGNTGTRLYHNGTQIDGNGVPFTYTTDHRGGMQ